MIDESAILRITHYGLNIYAHILRKYYPDEVVIELSGKECKLTRNPFNGNHKTLKISNLNWVFHYTDNEIPDFNGNPFDFAALYFQLSGNELLQKINDEMNLHIGENRNFYSNKTKKQPEFQISIPAPKFSFYRHPVTNTVPNMEITLVEVYQTIKNAKNKKQTEILRTITDKEQARKFKAQNFDYVTFSGTFSKRNDNSLIQHSELITIDFDHVPSLSELKKALLQDEYFETELMFTSPSGDGLKWIIPIDLEEGTHLQCFNAIAAYIKATYKLEIDSSGKDISRACFLPFDPEVYINPKYIQ